MDESLKLEVDSLIEEIDPEDLISLVSAIYCHSHPTVALQQVFNYLEQLAYADED